MSNRDTSLDPKILESAKNEFLKKGFIGASLKEISENAGVTTGAIYKRYRGKEELFVDVVKPAVKMFDEVIEYYFEINEKRKSENRMKESFSESLRNLELIIEKVYEKKELATILLAKSDGTIYSNFIHDFIENNFSSTYEFMEGLEREGMCKLKISYMEYHILLTSYWMAIFEIIIHDFSLDEALDFAEKIDTFFSWDKLVEFENREK